MVYYIEIISKTLNIYWLSTTPSHLQYTINFSQTSQWTKKIEKLGSTFSKMRIKIEIVFCATFLRLITCINFAYIITHRGGSDLHLPLKLPKLKLETSINLFPKSSYACTLHTQLSNTVTLIWCKLFPFYQFLFFLFLSVFFFITIFFLPLLVLFFYVYTYLCILKHRKRVKKYNNNSYAKWHCVAGITLIKTFKNKRIYRRI